MAKVSVIIPVYNGEKYIAEALDSALNQTFTDYEVIVVNDGSVDSTEDIVANYVQKHPEKIFYFYQKNRGLAAARNAAIHYSKGKYLALLDADDRWLPERLEETVKVMENDSTVGLVHSNIIRFSDNGVLDIPKRKTKYLNGMIFNHIFLRDAHIACPTVLIRRSSLDELGMFDENLSYLGCEDRDLWLRIARHSKVSYIDKVLAYYRINANSMSHNQDKMHKARLYVVDKHVPEDTEYSEFHLRKKALARIYRDRGDVFLSIRQFQDARESYKEAINYHPFNIWSWVNYLKTWIL